MTTSQEMAELWKAFWALYDFAIEAEIAMSVPAPASEAAPDLRVSTILAFAADAYGVTITELIARDRQGVYRDARALAAWALSRQNLGLSFPAIGRVLGGRHHTTILSSVRRAENLIQHSPVFAGAAKDIRTFLSQMARSQDAAPDLTSDPSS